MEDEPSHIIKPPTSSKTIGFSGTITVIPGSPTTTPRPVKRSLSASAERVGKTGSHPAILPPQQNNPKVRNALRKLSTSPMYKVTANTVHINIFSDTSNADINVIFTDEVFFSITSVGGMDTIDDEDFMLDLFVLHACIQSDPGDPTKLRTRLTWITSKTTLK